MSEIIFEHVTKTFNEQIALEDASFQIEKGEFVFVIGKSGAGKSTLLNLITRRLEPTQGKITVFDTDLACIDRKQLPYYRRKFGIMTPEIGMLKHMTVYDNIMLVMRAVGKSRGNAEKDIRKALGLVGLAGKASAFPEELSGGECARLLLARAMVTDPEVLIADEPTANLDGDSAWDMMLLLKEIHRQGKTLIISSHARELVTIMKKRVITLVSGRIVADEKCAIYNQKAIDIFEERRILEERSKNLLKKS